MTKAEIRKTALKRRKALTSEELQLLSADLLARFSSLDLSQVRVIHLFLPIASKNEPNTFLFIEWLQTNHPHIKILVPRADFDTSLMTHHEYPGADRLIKNLYDILEPEDLKPHTGQIDMVLIPLLAFDLRGYRVGYGKGFYDRFLSGITTRKVGVSLFGPEPLIENPDALDVRMDLCLCPDQIYQFS